MSRQRDLLVVGVGGLAKEVGQLARHIDPDRARWAAIEYVCPDGVGLGMSLPFGEVRWTDEDLLSRATPCDVVIAVGHPHLRRRLASRFQANEQLAFPNLIHPSLCFDAQSIGLGNGNILTQGVVMTCDIHIGNFNLFNWHVSIGHDARVGSYNVFNPSTCISGGTKIGDECLFGVGSILLEGLQVNTGMKVGAGAVVTRDLLDVGTYVGVPARKVGA